MPDVVSTSIAAEAGRPDEAPDTARVARAAATFAAAFAAAIGVGLAGASPVDADPSVELSLLQADLAAAARPVVLVGAGA
jgi:hypothetical protein